MAAEEDRAGIADLGGEFIRVLRLDFEVLGRQPVDQRNGRFKRLDQDDRAVIAPACAGNLRLRQGPQLPLDSGLDRVGESRVVGDEDGLRDGVVLGLRQQVRGDPVRIGVPVGEDQHLGRAGDHVDADLAEHAPLGRRHISVAGTDDLGDRLHRPRCHRPALRPPERRRSGKSRRRRQGAQPPEPAGWSRPAGSAPPWRSRGTPATFAGTAFIRTEDG